MPMDGIALHFAALELNDMLAGGKIEKIIQPERDEINLTVRNNGSNYTLLLSANSGCARAHLTGGKKTGPLEPPMFLQLLRKHLTGGKLISVEQINADRIIVFTFEHNDELGDRVEKKLYFECMGRNANLIFVNGDGRIIDSARHITELVCGIRDVLPGVRFEELPGHGKLCFDKLEPEMIRESLEGKTGSLSSVIAKTVSGVSKQTANELAYRITGSADACIEDTDISFLSDSLCKAMDEILASKAPQLYFDESGAPFDTCAFQYRSYGDLSSCDCGTFSETLDLYYIEKDRKERIAQKSSSIQRVLKNNIERCEKKIALQLEALNSAERMEEYRVKGELITAGLSRIKKGMKNVMLINYYDENCAEMNVELDEKLSPKENAQKYFKLYQKARSAKVLAAEQKEKTEEELMYLLGQAENLGKCVYENELNEIREELTRLKYIRNTQNRRQMKALPPSQPLKFSAPDGTVILVGKNNVQNEKLTFSAEPMEYWLHAKDMPGSHVIIVNTEPSEETIEYAAKLAAGYSSGYKSGKVPVDYTRRKYVKKPSGAKPGFVTFTNNRTLLVEPLRPSE